MRQAITTRYLSPTNTRGARIKARAAAGAVIVDWDHSLDVELNHWAAAKALAIKFSWALTIWIGGQAYDGTYVFVQTGKTEFEKVSHAKPKGKK